MSGMLFTNTIIVHTPIVSDMPSLHEKYKRKCSYFPARSIALLSTGHGTVVLPRSVDMELMWNFMAQQCGLTVDQVIWYELPVDYLTNSMDYALMSDRKANVALHHRVLSGQQNMVVFADRPLLRTWFENIGFTITCDTKEWRSKYGYKHILHPTVHSETGKSVLEELSEHPVRVPRGFVCSNTAELLIAVQKMADYTDNPITDVLLKPILGSDGDGIEFYKLDDIVGFTNYPFLMLDIAIEEKLNVQKHDDGSIMTVVTHYYKNELFGPSCDQLFGPGDMNTAFLGNIYPSLVSKSMREECEDVANELIRTCAPQGPGGFDFLFQDGRSYLVDVNGGRFNGGMYPKVFHQHFNNIDSAYVAFKFVPQCSLAELWSMLERKKMAFYCQSIHPRIGIFPLVHLPGVFGSYIAIGQTRTDALDMYRTFLGYNI